MRSCLYPWFILARLGIILLVTTLGPAVGAAPAPGHGDHFSDTWVATDALGRPVPGHEAVGPPRPDRTVGLFYFLWHGAHIQGGPYDITKILARDPDAMHKKDSPLWGPLHAPHHWGESVFGYYLTVDRGVLRKHAQMLADAGVDVIIFDVTNQVTYRDDYLALLGVFAEVRQQGNRVPQVAFICPFWVPAKVVNELYHDLYQPGLYPELWFRWQGKPLILADPDLIGSKLTAEQQKYFTFRRPQPDYFRGQTKPDMWSWLEVHPQHVFTNSLGQKEQMSVGVGQNAVGGRLGSMSEPGARGRSFHSGAHDPRPNAVLQGLNVAEQWERALREDPPFIFITGWNEWIAGRFDEFNGIRQPVMFVDQFDQEHSRDIEPMQGGHGDNYYYQMIANIRRYKGVRRPTPVRSRPIVVDGRFDDWRPVEPEFRDTIGDPVRREHRGWDKSVTYGNRTGRNDIVAAKVSATKNRLCFLVETQLPLTPPADTNWMVLFLDIDEDPATGWLGYDYVVNRGSRTPGRTTVERNVGGEYRWASVGWASWATAGRQLELGISGKTLGFRKMPPIIDFKWADNIQQTGHWTDFTVNGDVAPNDRFNHRAVIASKAESKP